MTNNSVQGLKRIFGWPRLRFVLGLALAIGLVLGTGWKSGPWSVLSRCLTLGFIALLMFGVFEQWPRRLPRWIGRWALQVLAVGIAMPVTTFFMYVASTSDGAPPFWADPDRLDGFMMLTALGVLLAPWIALGALVRQKEALARHQALNFALERSELERQALDAHLHLLKAQVAPHFLFNTLANIQALVEAGAPQAPQVLRSLIAYLRAAVPRLQDPVTTLADEIELVRAYLELMHMRMPDRLQYALDVAPETLALRCPPLTVLTLVENAVRHGIDPCEDGGRIDISVHVDHGYCRLRVVDSGVGLRSDSRSLGTGLAALRERLRLVFGDDAVLRISEQMPRGVCAEIEWPINGKEPA